MERKTDDQVTVSMVTEAKARTSKGMLLQQTQTLEQSAEFVKAQRAQSAVESAINGLEVHGLAVAPKRNGANFKKTGVSVQELISQQDPEAASGCRR
jgi:leucyl-tRNA synthetase